MTRLEQAALDARDAITRVSQEAYLKGLRDGAARFARAIDAGEPTYVSGSSDHVYPLATMPTRYIRNVLNMTDERMARGLRRAMEAELERRGRR